MKKNLLQMILAILFVLCFILSSCKANTTITSKVDESTVTTSEETTTIAETSETTAEKENERGKHITEKINSSSIAANKLGEDSEKNIHIYLPPSYEKSDKRYPVVYFLHGFQDAAIVFMNDNKRFFDKAMRDSDNQFIVVAISGEKYFYANSPVTGNWEDFVVKEVIDYVDTNYRTIPEAASRSITGYSMGGFGSIYLGLRHPDVYSSVVAFCPGLCAEGKIGEMKDTWTGYYDILRCYGQVFSPNDDPDKLFCNTPVFNGTPEDDLIIEEWKNGFGNLEKKVDDYLALGTPLNSIEIVYSSNDTYAFIPEGCRELTDVLDKKEVNYEAYELDSGHALPANFVRDYYVPFFEKNLKFE